MDRRNELTPTSRNILCTYQRDRNTSKWAEFLPMIQLIKNRRYHHGIKRSPFAAMFGKNYDDANESRGAFENPDSLEVTETNAEEIISRNEDNALDENSNGSITQEFDFVNHDRTIAFEREAASAGQEKQAEKMLLASKQRFHPVNVGDNVRITIDPVDRPKIGHRNLMVVDDLYSIGTTNGVLPQMFSRNQLHPCETEFISVADVPDRTTSFRAAVGESSVHGKQGHRHCLCTGGCSSNRCACKKSGLLCNSRCHHSLSCKNK
ncbi:unnamed protein product, partial [Mesorhabditis belari]|uniref:Uncharacterized protein n=1 Tax=Mesorhabditis belari TaxID=2138241 RepID=A0AAF3FA72_9BILA